MFAMKIHSLTVWVDCCFEWMQNLCPIIANLKPIIDSVLMNNNPFQIYSCLYDITWDTIRAEKNCHLMRQYTTCNQKGANKDHLHVQA